MSFLKFPKEFRFKNGSSIINYINKFSIVEKTIFSLFVLIACISTLLMLLSISNIFMVEVPAKGGEFTEALIGLPHTINPVLAITDVDKDLSSLIYSGLMRYSDGDLVPDLAESYKVSPDGLVYDFRLRSDIYFHDGSPITTADVAYTIQKVQSAGLKSPKRIDWNNVSVEIVGEKDIRFILKQAYSPFISNTTLGILPKHIWNNLNDDQFIFSQYNIEPVGSGPYKLKTIIRDNDGIPKEYKLTAFEKYRNKRSYIDNINIVFLPDYDKAVNAINNKIVDSISSVSAMQAKTFIDQADYKIISTPLPRIFGVFFNQNQNTALLDKNVRQALNLAVDRSEIINKVLGDYGITLDGPLPYEINETSSAQLKNSADPSLAMSILEKSGWVKNKTTGIYEKKGSGNSIQILSFNLVTSDTSDLKQTAEMLKDYWEAIGARVEIRIFESAELYQNIIRPRNYDALLFGQLIGKDRDLYAFWHSSQRNSPGLNVAMYANSKVDKILEDIRSTNDEMVLKSKYPELEEAIEADIPAIFLYSPDFIYIIPEKLRNVNIKSITTSSDRWGTVTDWYIKKEKIWKIFANKN